MAETDKRNEILNFVRTYIEAHGYGPSIREICEGVCLRSTATAHYHLRLLTEQGLLHMENGKKRAISLGEAAEAIKKTVPTQTPSPERALPIVGSVAAGQPILAQELIDGYLPWEGGPGWFALRVKGESMKNAGILSGDLVIVRPQPTAENGEIVVALLGDEATVKRFSRKGGHVRLLPENEAFSPIDGDDAVILGLVRGVVRRYD